MRNMSCEKLIEGPGFMLRCVSSRLVPDKNPDKNLVHRFALKDWSALTRFNKKEAIMHDDHKECLEKLVQCRKKLAEVGRINVVLDSLIQKHMDFHWWLSTKRAWLTAEQWTELSQRLKPLYINAAKVMELIDDDTP